MENTSESSTKHRKYSLILDKFPQDVLIEITKITMMSCDNNMKCVYIKDLLRENDIEFTGLGSGTNRYAIDMMASFGMVAVKIALDDDGMTDNQREFRYGKELYPYVCKVYECLPNGLIAVFEYVTPFNLSDLTKFEPDIREILDRTSKMYMIGDVGITPQNYKNWGIRRINGKDYPVMLDFAYIYSVTYKLFICDCDGVSTLQYDDTFVGLICPRCKRKYKFSQIRRKVTRQKQMEEIGDLKTQGYVLTEPEMMIEDNIKFMPKITTASDRKKEKQAKKEQMYENLKRIGKSASNSKPKRDHLSEKEFKSIEEAALQRIAKGELK